MMNVVWLQRLSKVKLTINVIPTYWIWWEAVGDKVIKWRKAQYIRNETRHSIGRFEGGKQMCKWYLLTLKLEKPFLGL
jgi:hypothetical protein